MGVMQKFEARFTQLTEMIDITGALDQVDSTQSMLTDLRRAMTTCMGCRDTTACRTWLDENQTADKAAPFCPNAKRFTRMSGRL